MRAGLGIWLTGKHGLVYGIGAWLGHWGAWDFGVSINGVLYYLDWGVWIGEVGPGGWGLVLDEVW